MVQLWRRIRRKNVTTAPSSPSSPPPPTKRKQKRIAKLWKEIRRIITASSSSSSSSASNQSFMDLDMIHNDATTPTLTSSTNFNTKLALMQMINDKTTSIQKNNKMDANDNFKKESTINAAATTTTAWNTMTTTYPPSSNSSSYSYWCKREISHSSFLLPTSSLDIMAIMLAATLFVGIMIGILIGINLNLKKKKNKKQKQKPSQYKTVHSQNNLPRCCTKNRGPHGNECDDNDGSIAVLKGALQLISQMYNIQLDNNNNNDDDDDDFKMKHYISNQNTFQNQNGGKRTKVVECQTPQQLSTLLFNPNNPSSLSLAQPFTTTDCNTNNNNNDAVSSSSSSQFLQLLSQIQKYSVNSSHPYFFNQLYGRVDPIGLAAELVTVALNASSFTYEVSPVLSMMEYEVISHFARLAFFDDDNHKEGEEDSQITRTTEQQQQQDSVTRGMGGVNGIILPGGSYSNLMALHLARHSWRCANQHIISNIVDDENDNNNNDNDDDSSSNNLRRLMTIMMQAEVKDEVSDSDENEEKKATDDTSHHRHYQEDMNEMNNIGDVKTNHRHHPSLVAFVSSEAHYSFTKAVSVTGIGMENLVIVPSLPDGQMDTYELDKAITRVKREGRIPFFVAATAGSTVRGSFDNIEEIVSVCRSHETIISASQHHHHHPRYLHSQNDNHHYHHKIWVHVDGAWGGSIVFSNRTDMKALRHGLSKADSFVCNPHKMLGTPVQTSAFVTKHTNLMLSANASQAQYLFDERKIGASYDLGDATFSCSRRADAVKFWALWKYYGADGLGRRIEEKADILSKFAAEVEESDAFMLACQPWPFNVCFFYLPVRIRKMMKDYGISTRTATTNGQCRVVVALPDDISKELSKVSVELKLRLHRAGEMMIPYQPVACQKADCFRLVLSGKKKFDETDINHLMRVMDEYGSEL